jgi:hypothetical protein
MTEEDRINKRLYDLEQGINRILEALQGVESVIDAEGYQAQHDSEFSSIFSRLDRIEELINTLELKGLVIKKRKDRA